nr:MAG TPA: hypothetical protein [Caudoviricetes sp.]
MWLDYHQPIGGIIWDFMKNGCSCGLTNLS